MADRPRRVVKLTTEGAQYRMDLEKKRSVAAKARATRTLNLKAQFDKFVAEGKISADHIAAVESAWSATDEPFYAMLAIENEGGSKAEYVKQYALYQSMVSKYILALGRAVKSVTAPAVGGAGTENVAMGSSAPAAEEAEVKAEEDETVAALAAAFGGFGMGGGYRRRHSRRHRKAHRKSRRHQKSRKARKTRRHH
jgi:hypothetical protein